MEPLDLLWPKALFQEPYSLRVPRTALTFYGRGAGERMPLWACDVESDHLRLAPGHRISVLRVDLMVQQRCDCQRCVTAKGAQNV